MPLPSRDYDRSQNPELERIQYQIDVVNQELEGLIDGLSDSQLHWQPSTGVWSIAQNLDHLNITNRKFIGIFEEGLRKARAEGKLGNGPYSYSWLSRYVFRAAQPPVRRKFRAPRALQPSNSKKLEDLYSEWKAAHNQLSALVKSAEGIDLAAAKVPSLVGRWIKFNLGMALWIQTAHDRRHLWTARELRISPTFPK